MLPFLLLHSLHQQGSWRKTWREEGGGKQWIRRGWLREWRERKKERKREREREKEKEKEKEREKPIPISGARDCGFRTPSITRSISSLNLCQRDKERETERDR
jgi:hypothetical protein